MFFSFFLSLKQDWFLLCLSLLLLAQIRIYISATLTPPFLSCWSPFSKYRLSPQISTISSNVDCLLKRPAGSFMFFCFFLSPKMNNLLDMFCPFFFCLKRGYISLCCVANAVFFFSITFLMISNISSKKIGTIPCSSVSLWLQNKEVQSHDCLAFFWLKQGYISPLRWRLLLLSITIFETNCLFKRSRIRRMFFCFPLSRIYKNSAYVCFFCRLGWRYISFCRVADAGSCQLPFPQYQQLLDMTQKIAMFFCSSLSQKCKMISTCLSLLLVQMSVYIGTSLTVEYQLFL